MKTTIAILATAFITVASAQTPDATSPLRDQLSARQAQFAKKAPPAVAQAYEQGVAAVEASGVVKKAKQVGEKAPAFTLKNPQGQEVSLESVLAKGPVVLTWYRGGWCPYCNLSLAALQKALPEINAAGGQIIALTPELPDPASTTQSKHQLTFTVLTDLNHGVAKAYGTLIRLTPEVAALYREKFGLTKFNGPAAGEDALPLAATYVIDRTGVIRWSFLHPDYRQRAEPADIVQALKALQKP
jgi:peroxiredoxin